MKLKNTVGFAIAAALAASLTGCNEVADPDLSAKAPAVPSAGEIDSATRSAIAKDERELKEELGKLQAKDPAVKDMYYKYDENGQKEVVIVREVKDSNGNTQMAESIFPMMAGMMLGQMMASSMMMSAMAMAQMGNMNSGYGRHSYHSSQSYRQRKNMATSSYAGGMRNNQMRSYGGARPTSSMSSRSSGAFSSSSSARSSGYSAGG